MNILIVDTMHFSIFDMFKAKGWQYTYLPNITREEIKNCLAAYDGLVIRSKTKVDADLLADINSLKFIARAGAGLDLIAVDFVEQRGIKLFHAGTGNRDSVGEHTIGMLLSLFNNLNRADRQVRKGIWDREGNRGVELMHKTVGIIGYGNNGMATAKRLSGFGCTVLAYDKYLENYGDQFAQMASMKQIQEQADVVSFHVPLTSETKFFFNDSLIEAFSNPFYLINVARGEIVDIESLVNGLKNKKVLGACLDVLENEKLNALTTRQQEAMNYLMASDEVIFSPHIAGWTHESYIRINQVLVDQIASKF